MRMVPTAMTTTPSRTMAPNGGLRAAAEASLPHGETEAAGTLEVSVAKPDVRPDLPSLYNLPSDLSASYGAIPLIGKILLAGFVAILLNIWNRQSLALWWRPVKLFLRPPRWKEALFYLLKFTAAWLTLAVSIQEIFYAPSRITTSVLQEKYYLPSTLSSYRPLLIGNSTVGVHWLELAGERSSNRLVYVNHGFGASSLSWLPPLQPLVDRLGAVVGLGHDAMGFGFTDRSAMNSEFTTDGSSDLGVAVIQDWERRQGPTNLTDLVLMGHSLGTSTTLRMAMQLHRPDQRQHVILVSPVLRRASGRASNRSGSMIPNRWRSAVTSIASLPAKYALRRVVGSRNFWARGLRPVWGDPSRLTESDVLRFTWPSIGKGWEGGLLRFSRAQLLPRRLSDIEVLEHVLATPNVTVTVIASSKDPIATPRMIRALFDNYPSVNVIELEGLGHDPFEEDVETFVSTVENLVVGA